MHNENAHKHTHLLLDLHTSSRRPLSSDLFSTWRREGRIEGSLIQGTELKIHHNYTQTKKNINSVLFITSATLRCREDDGKSVIGENKHIWWGSGQGVWRSNRNDMSMSQKGRERTKDKKKKKKRGSTDRGTDVSYCKYCAAVRCEPGVFTGPQTRCLCRNRKQNR